MTLAHCLGLVGVLAATTAYGSHVFFGRILKVIDLDGTLCTVSVTFFFLYVCIFCLTELVACPKRCCRLKTHFRVARAFGPPCIAGTFCIQGAEIRRDHPV